MNNVLFIWTKPLNTKCVTVDILIYSTKQKFLLCIIIFFSIVNSHGTNNGYDTDPHLASSQEEMNIMITREKGTCMFVLVLEFNYCCNTLIIDIFDKACVLQLTVQSKSYQEAIVQFKRNTV